MEIASIILLAIFLASFVLFVLFKIIDHIWVCGEPFAEWSVKTSLVSGLLFFASIMIHLIIGVCELDM